MRRQLLFVVGLVLASASLAGAQTVTIVGETPNALAPKPKKNLPVMGHVACSTAQTLTAGRVVFPCTNLFGYVGIFLTDPNTGAIVTLATDPTHDAPAATSGPQVMGECDDVATDAIDEGDAGRIRIDCTSRALIVRPDGSTLKRYISVGSTEDESQVKATAGVLLGISARNAHASTDAYLKCTNLTAANTTPGSSAVFYEMIVPHASGYVDRNINATFDTALTCYIVTGKTDSDATEVGANDVSYNLTYK